ncbi:hypothetical protein ACN4EE_18090 [Geminocystis sp. CENA526]|uniref:hypothetical protein n=1 Tax=Geminocystis sp. CENA526 TaxID=1355871 RepID=UPI003D6E6485
MITNELKLKACTNPKVQPYIYELVTEARLKGYKATKTNLKVTSLDPFWIGTEGDHKKAQWLLNEIKKSSLADSDKLYLRRIHYNFVSANPPVIKLNGEPYQNTKQDWIHLGEVAQIARYLEYLDYENFIDGRRPVLNIIEQGEFITPEPIIPEIKKPWFYLSSNFDLGYNSDELDNFIEKLSEIDGYSEEIELRELVESRADLPEIYLSSDTPKLSDTNSSKYGKYEDYSHFYLEIWVEKNTLDDVLTEFSRNFKVNVIVGTGEFSITQISLLLQRVKEKAQNRPIRIFVLTDFDPAGQSIPLTIARKIEYFNHRFGYNLDIKLTNLALTYEQVVKYRLPHTPIKDTDKRKDKFEDNFEVTGATEIDALVAINDGKELLTNIILETIEPYRKYDELVRKHYSGIDTYSNRSQIVNNLNRELLQPLLNEYESRYEEITTQITELESNYQNEADSLSIAFKTAVMREILGKETEFKELYLTLKETIRKLSELKTDLEDTCKEIYQQYREQKEELNENLRADLSPLSDQLDTLNDEFVNNSELSLQPIKLQSPQKLDESHVDFIYSSELTPFEQVKKYKQWQGKTLDI